MDTQFDPKTCSAEDAEQFLAERLGKRLAVTGANLLPGTSSTVSDVGIDLPGVGLVSLADGSPVKLRSGRVGAGDGIEVRTPDPVVGVPYAVVARELLAALYTMIGVFGMPTENLEAANEVRIALLNAELLKVDEVIL